MLVWFFDDRKENTGGRVIRQGGNAQIQQRDIVAGCYFAAGVACLNLVEVFTCGRGGG